MLHYLVLAHDNLDQIEIITKRLKNKNSNVYVHLDKKIKNFKKIQWIKYISNRQHIKRWWTKMLKTELIWLKEIFKYMNKNDHIIIISDQCYPIKDTNYIEKYINNLGEKSCIHYMEANNKILNRIFWYYFFDVNFHIPKQIDNLIAKFIALFKKFHKNDRVQMINIIFWEIISLILPKRISLIKKYKIYRGTSRMVLSYTHIKFILNFIESKEWKNTLKHFDYTVNNDELFFQTILVNYKKNEIINECLWFTIREKWAYSPNFLTIDNLEEIKNSNKLFARKFDITKDKKIIEEINKITNP